MALHIQMSEEAEKELRRAELRNKLSSIGACLLFMLLGGGLLVFTTIYIAGEIPAEFISYVPPAEDGPPTNAPVQKELTQKSSAPTAEVSPSVIVAQGATAVNMAPVNISTSEGLDFNTDIDMGLSMDGDLGAGLGDGGSGLGSGTAGGSALEGTFYDLKQTQRGAPTGLKEGASEQNKVIEVLSGFFQRNWNAGSLNRYYASKQKLYASNFYLPVGLADYGPIAYKVGDPAQPKEKWVCKPAAWLAVYRGNVRAPKSGKFRFIGTGDDFLAVRFNRKTVLDAGYRLPTLWDKENPRKCWVSGAGDLKNYQELLKSGRDRNRKDYELINSIPECKIWNNELGGLTAGTIFEVKEGQTYPIEIAISEIPGGKFGFVLFIEDVTNGKNSKAKKYDIFRTNFSLPNKKEIETLLKEAKCLAPGGFEAIPYNEDSLIWTVVP
ncbi:MAG: hypothetical protein IJB31_00590 [Akkermansia sp.]|nr:hypothetical protein [Akkermansia sp.]